MRRLLMIAVISAQAFLLSSCAAAWQNVAYSDDLYSVHNKIALAERQKAEAELAKAQYEAQQAQYEAAMAKANAEAAKYGYTVTNDASFNAFDAVLADSYESAYARRLYGFSSPTYRMPSSYYSLRYSDAFFYASAYDPAFYNVVVSGDMVWVEPKYVTSMFGSWGASVIPSYSWYYGWNDPFYYWTNPYRYNYSWYYGWNNPYYWGWNCGYPYYHTHYYHHYHHHHHNHYRPHRPSYSRPPQNGRYPQSGSGSAGNTGHHQINRPGTVVDRNPGTSRPADRGGNTGGFTPSKPSTPSAGRATQPTYRVGGTANDAINGGSSYRGSSNSNSNSSNSGSSTSRGSGFTPSKPSTPSVGRATQPTYRSGGTSSSKTTNGSSSYRNGSSSSNRSSGSSSSNRSSGSSSSSSKPSYSGSSSSSSRSYSSPSSSSLNSARPSFSGGGNSRGR